MATSGDRDMAIDMTCVVEGLQKPRCLANNATLHVDSSSLARHERGERHSLYA